MTLHVQWRRGLVDAVEHPALPAAYAEELRRPAHVRLLTVAPVTVRTWAQRADT